MLRLKSLFTVAAAAVPITAALLGSSMVSEPAYAQQTPNCSSASADPDGDGWGFENGRTCRVVASSGSSGGGLPLCQSGSDPDGDGFGFEGGRSCLVSPPPQSGGAVSNTGGLPLCQSASDPDGDGYGFEGGRSCLVSNPPQSGGSSSSGGLPACQSNSDPDGDGFGFEGGRSCRISAAAQPAAPVTGGSANSGLPVCQTTASDTDSDGFGFEGGQSCQVTSATQVSTVTPTSVITPGVAPPPVAAADNGFRDGHPICLTDASDAGSNGFGYENNRTCRVVPGVTATRSQPLLNQRSCIPWLEIGYGNYKLQNNVWNSTAVFFNNWSQCIELAGSPGNYVAKWDYNWLDRSQGNEFAVKSYPQVYIGRKTQYNLSGSVAETGMPVRVDQLPQFWVEYDYSETGIVERNVALESFIHNSCEAEEHNKQFEMMVWVGVPTIRTPGTLKTSVTLSGREWDVYTNPALSWAYVAFVAKQPHTSGTLDWNAFINWSRDVGPQFGVPGMNRNGCMGAIEIGTETFWGTGTFSLNRFRVNGR